MRAARTRRLGLVVVGVAAILACGGGGGGSALTYAVTYSGNGATSGSVPVDANGYASGAAVTVLGNTGGLAEAGEVFTAWNTKANGSGTSYLPGQTFVMGSASVTLYAQWSSPSGFTVTYDANGATGGAVPVDPARYASTQRVTVLGNPGSLAYTGYTFVAWQTKADGSGTSYRAGGTFQMGTANVTLYALWAGGYAYAVNQSGGGAGTVSQYTIGPGGALTPMFTPSVTAGGNNPQQIAVDPSGRYAYVSNVSSNSVSQFTIGQDGALAAMSTPTISMGPGPGIYYPLFLAVHPTGKWAYVSVTQRGYVAQYAIGSTGLLSPMTPPTVLAGTYLTGLTVDPTGKYAYTANGRDNTVSQYTIDQATGALSAMTPPTVPAGGTSGKENAYVVAVEPKGRFAYVTNYFDGTVSQYAINQVDGHLSALTPPAVAAGGSYAISVATEPSGKHAYVTIVGATAAATVAQFDIDQTSGTLSPMTPATVAAGGAGAAYLTVDASGRYAYATSGDTGWGSTSIAQYRINQGTGALEALGNATVQAGFSPTGIVATALR